MFEINATKYNLHSITLLDDASMSIIKVAPDNCLEKESVICVWPNQNSVEYVSDKSRPSGSKCSGFQKIWPIDHRQEQDIDIKRIIEFESLG